MPILPAYSASVAPRLLNSSVPANASAATLQAICAWPVSGQYGPGTRILYYVLVAACILGRGSEWLRGACLAAALLLPAVAALHGIVLAAVHVNDAVDMDIYGAFQLCAIGILAGPATVKMSKTYFNTPGRNLIFLWTGLILFGLLSLTVESFRTNSRPSPVSGFANGMPNSTASGFPFCNEDSGPVSPLRRGSQNNIYIIKAPNVLTFGAVTLLSAACCIYAILQIVSMWDTILKLNWKKRFGDEEDDPDAISNKNMHKVNDVIRFYLRMIEIPLFSAAVLAILIVGEMNFFSPQVVYMSEPMASVGQWAPIVGTGLAALGSLYAVLAAGEGEGDDQAKLQMAPCHCANPHPRSSDIESVKSSARTPSPADEEEEAEAHHVEDRVESEGPRRPTIDSVAFSHPSSRLRHIETTHTTADHDLQPWSTGGTVRSDPASRIKFGKGLQWLGNKLGQAAPETYDDLRWRDGKAADFPTIPGEEERNAALPQIKASYNLPRDADGHGTPSNMPRRTRSRAGSFNGSIVSGLGIEGILGAASQDSEPVAGPSQPPEARLRRRRSTLEVPKHTYSSGRTHRDSSLDSDGAGGIAGADATQHTPTSPTITVSPEPGA